MKSLIAAFNHILIGVFIASCLSLAVKFNEYRILKNVHEIQLQHLEDRFQNIIQLQKLLGYGGAIHNFKNYVLRREESRLKLAKSQFEQSRNLIESLERNKAKLGDSVSDFVEIRSMINAYLKAIDYAAIKSNKELAIGELDQIVQVDDTSAIKSLNQLITKTYEQKMQFSTMLLKESEQSNVIMFVLELITMIALFSLVSFLKKRTRINHEELESTYYLIDEAFSDVLIFEMEDMKFIYANKGACENLGFSLDELRTQTIISVAVEYVYDDFMSVLAPLRTGEMDKLLLETVFRRSDGTHFDVQFELQISQFKGQRVFAAMVLDVSEQVHQRTKFNEKLEEMLAEERTLKSLLEISADRNRSIEKKLQIALKYIMQIPWVSRLNRGGIMMTVGNVLHLVANENLDDCVVKGCKLVEKGECHCGMAFALGETQYSSCVDHHHKDLGAPTFPHGHYNVPIMDKEEVLGVIVIYLEHGHVRAENEVELLESCADVLGKMIQLHRYEEQIVSVRRQEAVNTLIATYNHEINNPLAIAKAAVAMERKKNPSYTRLEVIDQSLERVEKIVREISTLSHQKELNIEDASGSVKIFDITKKASNE